MLALLALIPLDLLLFVPRWRFDVHPLSPFHLSLDFLILIAVVLLSAGTNLARPVRIVAAALYGWLLLFCFYQQAFGYFFTRTPALGEDWRLLLNLTHVVGSMNQVKWVALVALPAMALIIWLVALVFARLQRRAERTTMLARALAAAATLGACGLALAKTGIEPDEPIVQLQCKRMRDNWRASRLEADKRATLRSAPPDRRYDAFGAVKLGKKPSVYLVMIESYGEILATWDMTGAYQALLHRVEERLEQKGFHAATQYSAAPVHGGLSWFSIATVHTGILIDRPLAHQALENVGATLPTVTRFFHDQGYKTYGLMPGSKDRAGLKNFDLYKHDVFVDAPSLAYTGSHRWGYGEMPDQWTLEFFRAHQFAGAPVPRYLFFMTVSTHFPWGAEVPPYFRDWRDPDGPTADSDESWPQFPEVGQIGTPLRRSYFRSVAYDWRVLTEFIEKDPAEDLIVLVVGDHQPRLEWDAPDFSMNAPVHVIARDQKFLDGFAEAGFTPGPYAQPRLHAPLKHQALFSLLVSRLAAAYGDHPVAWLPDGIGLAGLNR